MCTYAIEADLEHVRFALFSRYIYISIISKIIYILIKVNNNTQKYSKKES